MSKRRGRPAKPRTAIEPMDRPAVLWQRAKDVADPKLGSEIGRLHFAHKMTATELEAAAHVAKIYGRYERMAGLKRSSRSPSYEGGYAGASLVGEGDVEVERRIGEAWRDLQALIPLSPPGLRTWLEQLAVEDRHIGPDELEEVRSLLRELAAEFGIVSGKNPRPKMRKKQRQTEVSPPPSAKTSYSKIDRETLREVLVKVNQNLQSDEIDSYTELFFTLRERKRFRAEKERANS